MSASPDPDLPTLAAVPFTRVRLDDPFWAPRQAINREATLPIEYEQCRKTGRLKAWDLDWQPGQPNQPHFFWDSDVAKWIEAAAYSLATHPDKTLERRVDRVVARMASAQQPDGYLNLYFTVVAPGQRWSNLADWHELYCAGHLMEAAVAYFDATGKRGFLDMMCRYADYIGAVFGRAPGQKRGYGGHPEIELALVKLYRATGEIRYLAQAAYFVDERGQEPNYLEQEFKRLQAKGTTFPNWSRGDYQYCQAHKPVREQHEVVGHAVRAMYLYCGMTDVAREAGDSTLLPALRALWTHLTRKHLYVTGGIGASAHNEGFTSDYHLPNETAYCETCASVSLVFWAHRMLHLTGEVEFADVMERALYNGCLSGVSLDGQRFFYANPLAAYPGGPASTTEAVSVARQAWFGCACCPPNIARLIASVGQYVYSEGKQTAMIHLYAAGESELHVGGQTVRLQTQTRYPWDGAIRMRLTPERAACFRLALRIPSWCPTFSLRLNGKAMRARNTRGYVRLNRRWQAGDTLELSLAMPVLQVEAHPGVRMDCGRVALQRGPLVYCLEQADNGHDLRDLTIDAASAFKPVFRGNLMGGITVLRGRAWRRRAGDWTDGALYRMRPSGRTPVPITAVPYCLWGNRAPGQEMLVWINRAGQPNTTKPARR